MAYDQKFFSSQFDRSAAAARMILRHLWTHFRPRTVVDLGCGTGTWLAEARNLGAAEIWGLDGQWVPKGKLAIPSDAFEAVDLEAELPRRAAPFDLAISVEVLEHLSPTAGERAVAWLCNHSSVILFSAAVPGQGGTNHVNEDWLSRWVDRFDAHGFQLYDVIRPRIWSEGSIPVWYRQNVVIFARPKVADGYGFSSPSPRLVDVVHPELFASRQAKLRALYERSVAGRWKKARRAWRDHRGKLAALVRQSNERSTVGH